MRFPKGCLLYTSIRAAAVNINRLTEMLADHSRAFNMPARTPIAPGRRPKWLAGFCSLPEGKIQRILFVLRDIDAAAGLKIFDRHMGCLLYTSRCV